MLYEGIKETENTRIEKDTETEQEIEMLYSFGVVLFEHTILESDTQAVSICYFEPEQVYDIVIEDKINSSLILYETQNELTSDYMKLFNLIKNEKIDYNNNSFKCTSHSVEYTL